MVENIHTPVQFHGSDPSGGAVAASVSQDWCDDLAVETCVPGIVTSDWGDVFEQVPVAALLAGGGASRAGREGGDEPARGPVAMLFCFGEKLPVFSFGR